MTYTPRMPPREHQKTALQRISDRPNWPSDQDVFGLLMDMGTGKTKVILDEFGARVAGGDLSNLLVIAPAGTYRNWDLYRSPEEPGEMTKHLDPALKERLSTAAWVSGGGATWKRSIEKMLSHPGPRSLVVNVEALSSVPRAAELCRQFMATGPTLMAVDESTTIKNHSAVRTKIITKLGEGAVARRIATGLLTPLSPMDIFSQFAFLDPRIIGFRSYYGFRARYAIMKQMVMGGRSINIEVAYRNLEELSEKIAPYSYRVLKEDCLDLEPKVYTARDVALSPEQGRLYRELREYATAQLDASTHVTATAVITQILRLQQLLCGHVVDEEGSEHDVPERRSQVLLDVLAEHQGKAIIWVPFDRTIRKLRLLLEREYGARSVASFWGGNAGTRGEDESRFKSDPECRFMLSTPGAGGRGNTWVVANLVVYYANTYNLEHRSQSEDRAHRDGQTNRVTYVDLIARETVDEKTVQALRKKINMATAITGENYREWLI